MVINLDTATVVQVCKCGVERVIQSGNSATRVTVHTNDCDHHTKCAICEIGWASPTNHVGSQFCENGAIASGGRYAHCQCDICSQL